MMMVVAVVNSEKVVQGLRDTFEEEHGVRCILLRPTCIESCNLFPIIRDMYANEPIMLLLDKVDRELYTVIAPHIRVARHSNTRVVVHAQDLEDVPEEIRNALDAVYVEAEISSSLVQQRVFAEMRTRGVLFQLFLPPEPKELCDERDCPISLAPIPSGAVYTTCDGCTRSFLLLALLEWLSFNKSCPLCRTPWTQQQCWK